MHNYYHAILILQIDASEVAYCLFKKNRVDCLKQALTSEVSSPLKEQSFSEEMPRRNINAASAKTDDYGGNFEQLPTATDYEVS